jgi:isopentenyl phosphate kinase
VTVVLKLGGSVITEKNSPETVDTDALSHAADAISAADHDIVLVHGGGSFGHHHAAEYGVTTTEGTRDAEGVNAIHNAMTRLSQHVVSALTDRGVPAVPVRPLSVATRDSNGTLTFPTDQIQRLLSEGFVPVTHGDVVAHADAGATVLSGDELVVALAPAVDATRIGVCSTVPGVLDDDGEVIPRIGSFDAVSELLGGSDSTDVSGGMAGKVASLLDLDSSAHVFGPDALGSFLSGGTPGTTIAAGNGPP